LISAAESPNVDAIHPGYGCFRKIANFADSLRKASRFKLIGQSYVIRLYGRKEKLAPP